MNILIDFLQTISEIKKIDVKNDMKLMNGKNIILQVPPVFANVENAGSFILVTPPEKVTSTEIEELIKVFDFLSYGSVDFTSKNKKQYILNFNWNKQITFNSYDEKGNGISTIEFNLKIKERR
jgi:hypothetical protein